MPDTEYATVTVDVAREVRIPIDLLDDDNLSNDELADCAVDWFWNHRIEALADEPRPAKDDVRFPLWPCRITALQKTMQSEQVATEPVIDVTDYELKRYLQQMDPFEFEDVVSDPLTE